MLPQIFKRRELTSFILWTLFSFSLLQFISIFIFSLKSYFAWMVINVCLYISLSAFYYIINNMSWYKLNNHWTTKVMCKDFRLLHLGNENTIENILCHVFLKKIRTTRVKKFVVNYINSISEMEFMLLRENYIKEYNDKSILWNPNKIMETPKIFVREIKGPHFYFRKDDTTLYMISRAFDFDMIIFNDITNTILDI